MRVDTVACALVMAALITCGAAGFAAQATTDKNTTCQLFTPAELAKYSGEPLSAGHEAAMGSGCQWQGRSETGSVMIQVVPARYHEPHRGASGFKQRPDLGVKGFVEMAMGGWNAGAITGAQAVVVAVEGPAASEAMAAALLTETIKRRAK